ncbi:MAG: GyrI-like domain-containing protein [Cellvibrio sp.]|uniref:GyrI-like domain-containing protein n=1 Tax=Cellvibrio sp. TaxID=1965322 RepID=UPI0031A0E552
MNDTNNTLPDTSSSVAAPRIEQAGPLLVAGLREQLDEHMAEKIPQLWKTLVACWDEIPQRVGSADYGLCIRVDDCEYYYMAACSVWDFTGLPEKFSPFIIPSQTYAVFVHQGSVRLLCNTIDYAFDQWLPESGYQHAAALDNRLHFFERYGEQFNPEIGEGDIEIWLPITK